MKLKSSAFLILLFSFLFTLYSCKSKKTRKTEDNTVVLVSKNTIDHNSIPNVNLSIIILEAYCKGVAPQSHEEYNAFRSEPESPFLLTGTTHDKKQINVDFETDSNGNFNLFLKPGIYCIKRKIKDVDFETFLKEQKSLNSEYLEYGDRECFEKWWNSCDGSFEILESNKTHNIEIVLKPRCFTGENPCIYYNGPLPP
jgi:hypothetical protein